MSKPVVFYTGNTVARAGNIVCVRGEYFESDWKAVMSDGRQARAVELQQLNRQSFKVMIPTDFEEGVYTLELSGNEPLTLRLNEPRVRWMQGDEGESATPDGWVRMQGECLRIGERAQPYAVFTAGDGTVTRIAPQRVYDDYSVKIALYGLAEGQYQVEYHNGYASCQCGILTVAPSPEELWGKKLYNVLEYGLSNESAEDCTEALRALLELAGREGGGILYFPRGRYQLTGGFHIPRGVILKGDGHQYTQLFWPDMWNETRLCEDGKKRWWPTALPEVMITADGDFAIEDMEFSAGRIGRLFEVGAKDKPVKNVRFDRVYVCGNYLAGNYLNGPHHPEEHIAVLRQDAWREKDMLRIWGSNVKIRGCDFKWSSRLFSPGNAIEYLLIQEVEFSGVCSARWWLPFGDLNKAIIEDCDEHEWTMGCGGDNIYLARIRIQDVMINDREAFTTDLRSGINYSGTAVTDGCRVTFPDDVDMTKAKPGQKVCVISGTGAGQYRYITEINGQTAVIAEPFLAAPDADSHLTISPMFTNWYLSDITIHNSGMLQFYVAQCNTVVDGVRVTKSAGIKGYGKFGYGGIHNNWYNTYINNELSEGNHYHYGGWYNYHVGGWEKAKKLPAYSFLYVESRSPELLILSCTMRNNRLSDDCMIYVRTLYEGGICDMIVDSNHCADSRCGIYIEGKTEGLLLSGNTFEKVREEVYVSCDCG